MKNKERTRLPNRLRYLKYLVSRRAFKGKFGDRQICELLYAGRGKPHHQQYKRVREQLDRWVSENHLDVEVDGWGFRWYWVCSMDYSFYPAPIPVLPKDVPMGFVLTLMQHSRHLMPGCRWIAEGDGLPMPRPTAYPTRRDLEKMQEAAEVAAKGDPWEVNTAG